ncbi:hypothetical protein ASPTUDRAFT_122040 [Aspergillus tubingensis CBS 134.48]|uniref:Uncharacterized protein n=1 Tax=Aspergillus tubingensis (strain CBS 134.48) TaxID=767770 RepID=A0A1L9N5C4_ASPTC|nr:hypothetical protein ASPTUDRAFT_122040 [Aspergillus tubingensis CBS 134.48]
MNPFDELPCEILSIIIKEAADWVALESLLQVSLQVRRLFAGDGETPGNREAIHIVKSMLTTNPMMHHDLHGLFCKCIALRQSSLAVTSLEQFRSGDHDQLSVVFNSSISQASLREMVHVAANIQRLACACLTTFLSRIRGIKPMCHLRNGSEVQYEPREAGPPSWIEEFRVYRALWHFQFYSDMLGAAERLKFPQEDLELLRTKPLVWDNPPESLEPVLLSVNEWLWGMFCEREDSFTDIPAVKRLLRCYPAYVDPLPDPSQLQDEYSVWAPPALPIDKGPNDFWGQGSGMVNRRSGSTGFYSYCVDIDLSTPSTRRLHYCYADSPIYREMGLKIWDKWRLYCLGIWYACDYDDFRWEYLGPDGSLVPRGCFPEDSMIEADYRLSFFIKPRVRERDEFCEEWSREKYGFMETSRAEETSKVDRRIRRKRKACQIGLDLPRSVQTRYQLRPR